MITKYKISIVIILIIIVSGVFVSFFLNKNQDMSNVTQQNKINKEHEENNKKQEQWKHVLGKGGTVIGDGENIIKDKF